MMIYKYDRLCIIKVHQTQHIMIISTYIKKLPKECIMNIMYAALSNMQSYNGRTIENAINEAIGSIQTERSDGSIDYRYPTLKSLKEKFT